MAMGERRAWLVTAVLGVLVCVGAWFRCADLGATGFSEDEVNKVIAVREYRLGNLSANAEHPMLMKTAMLASTLASERWNAIATPRGWSTVTPEGALRLPNALVGALTIVPLFLLARTFFGETTGLLAAALFALNPTASGINRIGKEDSFFLFFFVLAVWLYERARVAHGRTETASTTRAWYAGAGTAFGLMFASKYFPHYLGMWGVFLLAAAPSETAGGGARRGRLVAPFWFYAAMGAGFVVGNVGVLLPGTWRYLLMYVTGGTITHHGSYFAGRVYMNMLDSTPGGVPWRFYLVFIATKTPLPVLAATAVGLLELVRRRHDRGAVFCRVVLVFVLLPMSLAAAKFGRYMLPPLLVLDMVAALGATQVLALIREHLVPVSMRRFAAALMTIVFVGAPFVAQAQFQPHPALYQNVLGARMSTPGATFPNDELYDAGIREAVAFVVAHARPGAAIVSDAPGVVGEYVLRSPRRDLQVWSLSMRGIPRPPTDAWVIAQDSHSCFESLQMVEQLRRAATPAFTYRVRGTTAVQVFRMPW